MKILDIRSFIRATILLLLFISLVKPVLAQTGLRDVLTFGVDTSEKNHSLIDSYSKLVIGGLDEPARVLLPRQPQTFEGGKMAFKMAVDPVKQNYFTAKFWGSDQDKAMIMLFSQGKQIGYRQSGDIDYLHFGNGMPPFINRFIYVTIPLPIQQTKGKILLDLEIRSYGEIWPYGNTFEQYQKPMSTPTLGFYKVYTHMGVFFEPNKNELQGKAIVNPSIRTQPGEEVLSQLKNRVNKAIQSILNSNKQANQLEIMFLSPAYQIKWTAAYHNKAVIDKVVQGIDEHYKKFLDDPKLIYSDKNIYNGDWVVTGPIGRSIRQLWPQLQPIIDETFDDGKDHKVSHRQAWSVLMEESIKYSTTHRREYTNQSMIIDLFIYDCNRALKLINPAKALPEKQTMHYLYECLGLTPWLGSETPEGPSKSLGDHYWELTSKGLTKELGFVGYYGEVLDWVNDIYKETEQPDVPNSGDENIKQQLLKIAKARSYFRYPSLDNEGYKAMRAEAAIGWRDANHYPGDVVYGDRAIAWDANPLMTASTTQDPYFIGIAQQMIADNQLFNTIVEKLKLSGLRVTKSLLNVPDEYEFVRSQKPQSAQLPMADGMPDFVFADEEDGVVALKNGNERLYASLYWRAHTAINKLAKVHYITPTIDRLSNIYINSEFEPSGMTYTREDRVNFKIDGHREFYKGTHQASAGEILPIAKIPDGVKYTQGDNNVYAGRASFYSMEYGKYLIAMNTTTDKEFQLPIPIGFNNAIDLKTKKRIGPVKTLKVSPSTTIVLVK